MKKIINYSGIPALILMATLAFMPFSCSKEAVKENPLTDSSSQLIKISGEDANAATKTTLEGLATKWVATTDQVGIYCAQSTEGTDNIPYTASSTAFSSAFTGAMKWGTGTHYFYAYYPYLAGGAVATVVPISLSAAQIQSVGNSSAHLSHLDFMVATPKTVVTPVTTGNPTTVDLRYNHVFTVLEFQIKGSGTLNTVSLTVPTNPIAFSGGTINIAQSTPETGAAYSIVKSGGSVFNAVTVTLNTPATLSTTTATSVYMVINPGTQTDDCSIGLSFNGGSSTNISKAAPVGGFLRGKKYVVPIETDGDGNVYNTVTIGTQTWMASNLKTTKYNDGTDIPNVSGNSAWGTLSTGAYCWYNSGTEGAPTYVYTYGALYNWYAVNTAKLCPTGWHVATDAEWTTLTNYLGGLNDAGGKLKETGYIHWNNPNTGATNETGFTALPGGARHSDGTFLNIHETGIWWSSTEANTDYAWPRNMYYNYSSVSGLGTSKTYGYSVRCVKGETVSDNNGNVYSTVVTSTGKTWLDRNLGATQVATSSTDENAYGYLYQWGRGTDGHQIRTPLSGTTSTPSDTDIPGHANFILAPGSPYDWRSGQNVNLWQVTTDTNNPCPSGFRLPTDVELEAERASWTGSNNATGAFGSPLKLPAAGSRDGNGGSPYTVGSYGYYWSSTIDGTNSHYLSFYSLYADMRSSNRAYGFSVRCIKN